MKKVEWFVVVIMAVSFCSSIQAQDRWSVELRPNLAVPTTTLGDADLNTGFGFEVAFNYRFMEHLGAYAGWGYNHFNTKESSFAGAEETDVEETGYTFGLQFIHPIGASENLSYLVRAGAIYNHIELENGNEIAADSGHEFGWEVGAGVQFKLGESWQLRPQIGYRMLTTEIDIAEVTTSVDLNYVAFGIGITKTF